MSSSMMLDVHTRRTKVEPQVAAHEDAIPSCYPINRTRWPMSGPSPPMLTYVKFHKVGGTSASIAIGKVAARYNWSFCCDKGCNICAMHDSISQTRFGIKDANRTHYLITLLREPIDQLFSFYRFNAVTRFGRISKIREDKTVAVRMRDMKMKTNADVVQWFNLFMTSKHQLPFRRDTAWYFCSDYKKWPLLRNQTCGMDPNVDYFHNFDFVGVTENFDEFLIGLVTIFDWNVEDVVYRKRYKQIDGGPRPENFAQEDIELIRNMTLIRKRIGIYESARRKSEQLLEELRGTCEYQRNARKFADLQGELDPCQFKESSPEWFKKAGGAGLDCYHWKF